MVLDKPIIALDFDGTITKGDKRVWTNDIPSNDVFEEHIVITNWIRKIRSKVYLILWTCRAGSSLQNAIDYCRQIGIEFDSVNENIKGVFETSNKVYADYYVDDKAINVIGAGLECVIL